MDSDTLIKNVLAILWQGVSPLLRLPIFWGLVVIAILGWLYRRPMVKGWVGEKLLSLWLRMLLGKSQYHVIDDVTIPDGEGGTTQIDHIVVSVFSIFVIETKNVSGWIFGSERDATWTQKLHGNHSQKFQNPLRQNYKHTKTLAGMLELPDDILVSVVVFVGDTTFKNALPANVTYPLGCTRLIKARQELVLPPDEVARVLATIDTMRLTPGRETHRAHVAYLHEKHGRPPTPMRAAPAPPPSAPPEMPACTPLPKAFPVPDALAPECDGRACPRCGQPLVLRTARQGRNAGQSFWGCQGFPKCRYIAPSENA